MIIFYKQIFNKKLLILILFKLIFIHKPCVFIQKVHKIKIILHKGVTFLYKNKIMLEKVLSFCLIMLRYKRFQGFLNLIAIL